MKSLIALLSLLVFTSTAFAADDVLGDLDSLGGNKDLVRKARDLDPNNKVRIVQNRLVDRNMRLELGLNYGTVAGGDPYVSTDNVGGRIDFHFTPRFSMGVMYYQSSNDLSSEGQRVYNNAVAAQSSGKEYNYPDSDYAKETTMGVINFYPLYGKLNMFNTGIAQFDVYLLGGYGQVQLRSGAADTYTMGGGVGMWINQHFSARLEARYQAYEDTIASGTRPLDLTVLTAGIGFLL
ncbi:MAG: outer membrane beta-barrel domain-containing protein [Bdellovibrionales bacterium]|nr:outer membrane beta-barrel domain-containing protein [Bdellovibrionales bacterium]